MNEISFIVHGRPGPSGSKKGFIVPGTRRIIYAPDSKYQKPWQESVKYIAMQAMIGKEPMEGPLKLFIEFRIQRSKKHYGTGKKRGVLRDTAEYYVIKAPDLTKLVRATEDAMTGVVWRDDAQVASQATIKIYGDNWCGARIVVSKL